MNKAEVDVFLQLVRLGLGTSTEASLPEHIDWDAIEVIALQQGLLPIVFDGVNQLPALLRPPQKTWLRWIGIVMQDEKQFNQKWCVSCKLASLFQQYQISTYVLKGMVVAECYPKPQHRVSDDLDCFLVYFNGNNNAWDKGNEIIEHAGYKVSREFYKNSTFYLPGLTVENHRFLVPFRGNKLLRKLEEYFQGELRKHKALSSDFFYQSYQIRPPIMISALFLIEHAYSHFLHEGLTCRLVLDWMMFCQKHKEEIDWSEFETRIDEFGFRDFYNAYLSIGQLLLGEKTEDELLKRERWMLADLWALVDVHETVRGFKGKLSLVGSTIRAGWKYRNFSKINVFHALFIQVWGFLFIKNPSLPDF